MLFGMHRCFINVVIVVIKRIIITSTLVVPPGLFNLLHKGWVYLVP